MGQGGCNLRTTDGADVIIAQSSISIGFETEGVDFFIGAEFGISWSIGRRTADQQTEENQQKDTEQSFHGSTPSE